MHFKFLGLGFWVYLPVAGKSYLFRVPYFGVYT